MHELQLPLNRNASELFYTNRERCEVLTGCLSLGTGQAVNGRIRDIGQNVVQFSFQTGQRSSPSYCYICFFIALLDKDFNPLKAQLNPICHLLALLGAHNILHVSRIRVNRNIRITLCINNNNNNNAVINNNC